MKKYIIIAISLFLFAFISCKKTTYLSADRQYLEQNKTSMVNGPDRLMLKLMTDGKAVFRDGNDVERQGTYKVVAKNLTVTIGDENYVFKIVSEEELRYGEKVLKFEPIYINVN